MAGHLLGRGPVDSRVASSDRAAIVVSFAQLAGDLPISPRIQRTAHLTAALEREFEFQVARVPEHPGRAAAPADEPLPRRLARKALSPLVLDHLEIPARVLMRGWRPSGRGALLIGWPYSPIYLAASHLVAAGVPYVVDVGDPWVLTEPSPSRWQRRLSLLRARAAERFLWRHAAAGVVTTESQASGLRAQFPDLELLVRPNGYLGLEETAPQGTPADAASAGGELRLVHFGSINSARLPIGDWLSALPGSSGIRRVRFANYGPVDHPELLLTDEPAVVVEIHDPVDWARASQIARSFDAAVVIGNTDPAKLPSKAIEYLTLPVPRIALTLSGDGGELAGFATQRPGFVGAGLDSPKDIPRVIAHLRRPWSEEELSPSAGDSWGEVAREVVQFAIQSWDRAQVPHARGPAERVATA
ncbi:MAG TPA: hypothetical protein VI035_01750 [Solirubrobacterales bacterium]